MLESPGCWGLGFQAQRGLEGIKGVWVVRFSLGLKVWMGLKYCVFTELKA